MDFDLLGYNADFKKGNITLKLHKKDMKNIQQIQNLQDLFNNIINKFVDNKTVDIIQSLPNDIKIQINNITDDLNDIVDNKTIDDNLKSDIVDKYDSIIDDVSKVIENDIIHDDITLPINDINNIIDSLYDKYLNLDVKKSTKGRYLYGFLRNIASHNDILKNVKRHIFDKFVSDIYNKFKLKYKL